MNSASGKTEDLLSLKWLDRPVELILLRARYILSLFYIGLIVCILRMLVNFTLVGAGFNPFEPVMTTTITSLTLLDITMTANLVWLISAGSYYVFTAAGKSTPIHLRPQCLQHVSSGLLKEKMAGSLIGISSVDLLTIFLHLGHKLEEGSKVELNALAIYIMMGIHVAFILALWVFNRANAADHHDHSDEKHPEDHDEVGKGSALSSNGLAEPAKEVHHAEESIPRH
jgi:uncharacterized protein (TIGR00645 family)